MTGPSAARGTFPYFGHRTVAQIDAAARIEAEIALAKLKAHFSPPQVRRVWCTQCDGTVHVAEAACCPSMFCPLRKARAA